jgi:hypothetical protein
MYTAVLYPCSRRSRHFSCSTPSAVIENVALFVDRNWLWRGRSWSSPQSTSPCHILHTRMFPFFFHLSCSKLRLLSVYLAFFSRLSILQNVLAVSLSGDVLMIVQDGEVLTPEIYIGLVPLRVGLLREEQGHYVSKYLRASCTTFYFPFSQFHIPTILLVFIYTPRFL